MSHNTQEAVSDGTMSGLLLSIDYFDRSEISVFFDDVPADPSAWAWVGTLDKAITFSPVIANGVTVKVVRTTNKEQVRHVFAAGAQFRPTVLDENFTQTLRIVQELVDNGPLPVSSLDARYMGALSSDPLVDAEGAPIASGALYTNSVDRGLRVYLSGWWRNVAGEAMDAAITAAAALGTAAGNAATAVANTVSALANSAGSAAIGFINSALGSVPRTTQAKLRDTVSALDLGFVNDGNAATFAGTDNSAAWETLKALVLHPAVIARGGITVFFPDGVYCTDGDPAVFDHAGASFIHIAGSGHNSVRLIFRESSGLQFVSTGYNGTYETFHSRVVVENVMVVCLPAEVAAGTTDGVSLVYCAEVQLINVQTHYANEGLYIKDSPLVTTERFLATNCKRGISHKKSRSHADADLAVITHNNPWCSNNDVDIYIDGGRNITIRDGSLVSYTVMEIRATGTSTGDLTSDQVELVLIDGTFVDYRDFTSPAFKIGNPADTAFQIKRVMLNNIKYATSPSFTKDMIRIDSPLVGYVSINGGECSEVVPKFAVIGSSCLPTVRVTVDGIGANNCFKYRIRDERSTTKRTELFKHEPSLQHSPSLYHWVDGYYPLGYDVVQIGTVVRDDDAGAFVTGDSSMRLLASGVGAVAALVWTPQHGDVSVEAGTELAVEWIAYAPTFDVANSVVFVTTDLTGGAVLEATPDTVLTSLVQVYSSGFERYVAPFVVPAGRLLRSIRVQGLTSEDVLVDYFNVYGPAHLRPAEPLYAGPGAHFADAAMKVAKFRGLRAQKRYTGEADVVYACRKTALAAFEWA